MCEEKNLPPIQGNPLKETNVCENGRSFRLIDFFLTGTIEDKEYYHDFLRAINSTSEYDEIHIHINNYGGDLDCAIQIYHSLLRCKARIFIYVEGACCSAASVIMMSADEIEFCPWCEVMIHAYSGGDVGKYHEIQSATEFHKKWFTKLMNDVYGEFLSKKELSQVLGGKDLYLDAEEAKSRFDKIFRKREREYSKMKRESDQMIRKMTKMCSQLNNETDDEESD
jgi:ATP-dependent protease ClpP protease subunit